MKRLIRLDSVLNVLVMASTMTLASPAIASASETGSTITLAIDDNVGNVTPGQSGGLDHLGELRSPEVVDPESEGSEVSGAAMQPPIESIHDIRTPEVRDPEVETHTPDIQGPDIEINVPEMETPDVPEVPSTPEIDVPDS